MSPGRTRARYAARQAAGHKDGIVEAKRTPRAFAMRQPQPGGAGAMLFYNCEPFSARPAMNNAFPLKPDWLCEKPGVYDTGTGALKTIEANPGFPGIERVTITSYCGRHEDDRRYYRLAADRARA